MSAEPESPSAGDGRARPQGSLDVGSENNDGSLTADGRTWTLHRGRKDARAESEGALPMTATLASSLTSRWALDLDGQSYSMKTRHALGSEWVLRDEHRTEVGSVAKDSVNSRLAGGHLDGTFDPVVSNAAGLFVLYVVLTIRRDNNRSGGRISAGGS